MPVREAVSRLASDGALEVAPNRALRVPILSASAFRELAETRMAVEGMAASRAAMRRSGARNWRRSAGRRRPSALWRKRPSPMVPVRWR